PSVGRPRPPRIKPPTASPAGTPPPQNALAAGERPSFSMPSNTLPRSLRSPRECKPCVETTCKGCHETEQKCAMDGAPERVWTARRERTTTRQEQMRREGECVVFCGVLLVSCCGGRPWG